MQISKIVFPLALTMVLLLLVSVRGAAAEENQLAREWRDDLDVIQMNIMGPVRGEMELYEVPPGWKFYRERLLDSLRSERHNINRNTYQIMRDIMLMLTEDFEEFLGQGTWQVAQRYLTTKLELVDNLLSMTGDG